MDKTIFEISRRRAMACFRFVSDALPFGRLQYGEPNAASNAVDYTKFFSRSHQAVIRIYDQAGNVIETHEHKGGFKEPKWDETNQPPCDESLTADCKMLPACLEFPAALGVVDHLQRRFARFKLCTYFL